MAKKKTVADQSRSGHVSSFTGGLNTDLHPMLQPNDTLTDCVNGTLITYNGNENMLQNDMGNYELKHAQLPEGYIPMGMKEHQGILYIASWNPFEKRAQIGSYPSPKTVFGEENGNEYTISSIEIGEINTEGFSDSQLAELIFNIAEKTNLPEGIDPSKHLISEIDLSQTEKVFTDNFDESTKLGAGDRYWLSTPDSGSYEDDFQKLEYFLIDEDKNKHILDDDAIVCGKVENNSPNLDDFTPITFDHSGWLGARYLLKDIAVPDIDVTINEDAFTSENYLQNITTPEQGLSGLEVIKELWQRNIPAHQIPTIICNTNVKNTYESLEIPTEDAPDATTDDTTGKKVFVGKGFKLVLDNSCTAVEKIIITENSESHVVIPEGITTLKNRCLSTNLNTLDLPTTITTIEGNVKFNPEFIPEIDMRPDRFEMVNTTDESGSYTYIVSKPVVNTLIIRGNYRHPTVSKPFVAENVQIVPNNLHYYNKYKPFYTSWRSDSADGNAIIEETSYVNMYEYQSEGYLSQTDCEMSINTNTDHHLLDAVFPQLTDAVIITPKGKSLNTSIQYDAIDARKLVIYYSKLINKLTRTDLPQGVSLKSIRVNTDCSIERGVVTGGQSLTVTKNTDINLSNLPWGSEITLKVLGVQNENELNRFISTIVWPYTEREENQQITVNVYSDLGEIPIDSPKDGVSITSEYEDLTDYVESNTLELELTDGTDWSYCNVTSSFKGEINTYTLTFGSTGNEVDHDSAFNVLNKYTNILKESVLIIPTTNEDLVEIVVNKFKTVINSKTENINNILANVVFEGDESFRYYTYAWQLVNGGNAGNFDIKISASGEESNFGIKVRTPLFKYEEGVLKVKDFYASFHDVSTGGNVITPDPKANIVISTEMLSDNCKVVVRLNSGTKDSKDSKYYILSNECLSVSDQIVKSDEYTINSYTFKQSENQILIEDLNTKTANINKNSIVDDLSIYRYGKYEDKLRIQLEWPQAIDQSECYWTITDLDNNIVVQGEVLQEMYFDSINLDIDLNRLPDYWYMFNYYTPSKVYRRPLFAKTKVTYDGTTFYGPEYVDYVNAYYEELAGEESSEVSYTAKDLTLGMTNMQVCHKKEGEYFTWDTNFCNESPKALWWKLMPYNFEGDNTEYFLGTRKYQQITVDFEKLGFVKGVTEYSVELEADGYDMPKIVHPYGIYDVENNKNSFIVPVGESIQKVVIDTDKDRIHPFIKEYLIQNAYMPIEFDCSSLLNDERALIVSSVCDWDKGKMLCVDKTSGETNDCSIALIDPSKYDENADAFSDGNIISGEGNFINKTLSKVNNLFVPIVARVKTDDNGFVFPVIQNTVKDSNGENKWGYKVTWDEARGKKNSDNKRSPWSENGLGAVVHTKNNKAAAVANLALGISQLLVVAAMWIATAVLSVVSFGAGVVFTVVSSIVTGVLGPLGMAGVTAGIVEFTRKQKSFKLLALRGQDKLLLPIWGKQSHENRGNRRFIGQARYDDVDWKSAEKMMLFLGTKIYAPVYDDTKGDNGWYFPMFSDDKKVRGFKLKIYFKNTDIKSGGVSLKLLAKTFATIYGIETNNFTSKVSKLGCKEIDYYKDKVIDIVNKWNPEDSFVNSDISDVYATLAYQIDNWKVFRNSSRPTDVVCSEFEDSKINNFAKCLSFDPITKCFYYSEKDREVWFEKDGRWAFGPNRGGCQMRIKRNFWRKKKKKISQDKDWIDTGEFPRFNNDVITPIAYPILPHFDSESENMENIANTYIREHDPEGTPVCIETISSDIKNEDIITEDCMNYLEYIYYDKIKEIQTTNSTN